VGPRPRRALRPFFFLMRSRVGQPSSSARLLREDCFPHSPAGRSQTSLCSPGVTKRQPFPHSCGVIKASFFSESGMMGNISVKNEPGRRGPFCRQASLIRSSPLDTPPIAIFRSFNRDLQERVSFGGRADPPTKMSLSFRTRLWNSSVASPLSPSLGARRSYTIFNARFSFERDERPRLRLLCGAGGLLFFLEICLPRFTGFSPLLPEMRLLELTLFFRLRAGFRGGDIELPFAIEVGLFSPVHSMLWPLPLFPSGLRNLSLLLLPLSRLNYSSGWRAPRPFFEGSLLLFFFASRKIIFFSFAFVVFCSGRSHRTGLLPGAFNGRPPISLP